MDKDEALKLALKALETGWSPTYTGLDAKELGMKAITAIKQALADIKQDLTPVQKTTGQAPCARHCEATAFQIVIKNLKGDIERLKAAQPEPVQEPVAWAVFADNGNIRIWSTIAEKVRTMAKTQGLKISPLYTTPPAAQRQWVGLTDGDIAETDWHLSADREYEEWTLQEQLVVCGVKDFARAIEAKLKEKNGI